MTRRRWSWSTTTPIALSAPSQYPQLSCPVTGGLRLSPGRLRSPSATTGRHTLIITGLGRHRSPCPLLLVGRIGCLRRFVTCANGQTSQAGRWQAVSAHLNGEFPTSRLAASSLGPMRFGNWLLYIELQLHCAASSSRQWPTFEMSPSRPESS